MQPDSNSKQSISRAGFLLRSDEREAIARDRAKTKTNQRRRKIFYMEKINNINISK